MRFRLLTAGVYHVGLSGTELAAARRISPEPNITVSELTPVVAVALSDVLIGEVPISRATARPFGVDLDEGRDEQPAMLSRTEALTVAYALGCRLTTEAEWESCCRAGSSSLFVWGATLPTDAELERWMAWDIADANLPRNEFGFCGLFFGEWCDDEFRASHDPGAPVEPGVFVVKGGGAQFWPWQDEEWVWCLPAMRMPSTSLFADGRCAARLAFEL